MTKVNLNLGENVSDKKEIKSKLKLNALAHAYNDIYFYIIPLLLPFLREDFRINYVQLGLILTAHVALRSLFSLIFGHFGDQYDKRIIIAGGFVCSSIFLGGLFWANNIHSIVTFLILLGIGVSTFHPLALAIVRESTKVNQRGHYLSIFEVMGTVGVIIFSLLFGFSVKIGGWKLTCLLLSFPGYFLAYAYLKLKLKKNKKNFKKMEVEKKIKQGYIYLFFVGYFFRTLGFWAILSFLPLYITDYIGLRPEISTWVISTEFIGRIIGSLISIKIVDKNQPLVLILSTTIIAIFLTLGITFIANNVFIVLLIIILGISEGIFFPSQDVWLTFICPVDYQGRIFGISLFVEGIAATIAPTLYGWIADQFSLVLAYRLAAVPLFISSILFMILQFLEGKQEKIRIRVI